MALERFDVLKEPVDLETLCNEVAKIQKNIKVLLGGGLDWDNVNYFQINLDNGGYILMDDNGLTVNDGTKDTVNIPPSGFATLVGALFMSALGYPRVEINSEENLFKASRSANDYISILPSYSGGSPAIFFNDGSTDTAAFAQVISNLLFIATVQGQGSINISSGASLNISSRQTMEINSNSDIKLNSGGDTSVNSWRKLYNRQDEIDLQTELDYLQAQINNLYAIVSSGGGS